MKKSIVKLIYNFNQIFKFLFIVSVIDKYRYIKQVLTIK